jgi:hypothetical protein
MLLVIAAVVGIAIGLLIAGTIISALGGGDHGSSVTIGGKQ